MENALSLVQPLALWLKVPTLQGEPMPGMQTPPCFQGGQVVQAVRRERLAQQAVQPVVEFRYCCRL